MASEKIILDVNLFSLIILILILVKFAKLCCEIFVMNFDLSSQLIHLVISFNSFKPIFEPKCDNKEKEGYCETCARLFSSRVILDLMSTLDKLFFGLLFKVFATLRTVFHI